MKVSMVRVDVLMDALGNKYYSEDDSSRSGVSLNKKWRLFDKEHKLAFDVNWCAKGATDPAEAKEFANELLRMTDIAEGINNLNYEIEWSSATWDSLITDSEKYAHWEKILTEVLKDHPVNNVIEVIKEFFNK